MRCGVRSLAVMVLCVRVWWWRVGWSRIVRGRRRGGLIWRMRRGGYMIMVGRSRSRLVVRPCYRRVTYRPVSYRRVTLLASNLGECVPWEWTDEIFSKWEGQLG